MTLKLYLAGIIFTTVLALASFLLIISYFSPEGVDALLTGLLFFSLFIGLTGLFSLAGFFIRSKKYRNNPSLGFLKISFRQGSLLAMLLAGSLFLRTYRVFWWESGLILLVLVLAAEFFSIRKSE
jgi:hypothetical protein